MSYTKRAIEDGKYGTDNKYYKNSNTPGPLYGVPVAKLTTKSCPTCAWKERCVHESEVNDENQVCLEYKKKDSVPKEYIDNRQEPWLI